MNWANVVPRTFSLVQVFSLPPFPEIIILNICIQCVRGGGGLWGYAGVYHTVYDQIQNLQNCYTTPNKNLQGEVALDR
jgi:hypothetical protein